MINGEGGRIAEENRVEYVMDMTETAGTVWLGLTLNCCRCHDHKFDPLTQRDYFSLSAFFNQTPVDGSGGNPQTPPILETPNDDQQQRIAQFESMVAVTQTRLRSREQELAKSQEVWEKETLASVGDSVWQPMKPLDATANHQTLTINPDGSILASGDNPRNDTYTITLTTTLPQITAIRLDALNHESHTQGGLARSDSGNFVLTEIEPAIKLQASAQATALKIASAIASYEQGDFKIDRAFDGNPNTGWAVYAGKPIDQSQSAVFQLAEPIMMGQGAEITITLRHDSSHAAHNIGRFRLSVSGLADAKLENGDDSMIAILRTAADQRTPEQREQIAASRRAADPEYAALQKQQEGYQKSLNDLRGSIPKVMVMQDLATTRKTYILERGVYSKPGDEVTANVPETLPSLPAEGMIDRLALARWIVSEENPLTARVTVNRIWQQFFGVGLVKTTEDFGVQGEIPIQQDLLDWLAADFRQNGWDVKRLVQQIVTSHTYRQSSRIGDTHGLSFEDDPENRYLSRGPRFRLPSWMIRDQALAASGLVVRVVGGSPVKGYQPTGVWEEATFGGKKYVQDKGDALYRRSLYTFWRRIVAPTMFFDNASRQTCTVKMYRTNTPLHSLLTLNDVTFVEAARALAEHVLIGDLSKDEDRIDMVFRRLLARTASDHEKKILLSAIERSRKEFQDQPEAAAKLLAIGESKRNEQLDPIEHGVWASLALAVMNLDETLTKE
ncbi:MAG TPA: hypothetical protein DDZ51_05970 [Planctomycetaceae bacterium]|nr:hypothetical protein [Planctomycetaceae bacterium]